MTRRIDPRAMVRSAANALTQIVEDFIADDALSRGAAIAFYATTALVPILFIIVSIAGMLFGPEAARGALKSDIKLLVDPAVADLLQAAVRHAAYTSRGAVPTILSIAMLIVVASGFFGEIRAALNKVFGAAPQPTSLIYFLRVSAESLSLVAGLAGLLLVSMVVTTLITIVGPHLPEALDFAPLVLGAVNVAVTWVLTTVLFAAIYRVLPDKHLPWHDVAIGGFITAALFQFGQVAIAIYLGSTRIVTIYGAAGSLMALLLWIFYSAEIFLFGAELTKVYAERRHHWMRG